MSVATCTCCCFSTALLPKKLNISKGTEIQLTFTQSHEHFQATTNTQTEVPQANPTSPLQLKTPPLPTHNHRYLLALGYQEQLSAATHSMFSLGALALDWRAGMVEPFMKKSFLIGLQNVNQLMPHLSSVKISLRLFEVYDKKTVNKYLHEVTPQVSMFDFDTFIMDASEDITFLYYRAKGMQQQSSQPVDLLECHSAEQSRLKSLCDRIEEEMNSEKHKRSFKNSNFEVKRIFCLDQDRVYRTDQLEQYLPNATTIIISEWRGCGLQNCAFDDKKNAPLAWRDSFRFGIQARTIFNPRLRAQHLLHHPSIEDYAKRYLSHLGYAGPFISIHIRTERLVKNVKKDPMQCLKELAKVSRNLTQNQKHEVKTLLLTDVGSPYGTSTCQMSKNCNTGHTQRIMDELKGLGFKHQWYDPRVLHSTDNNGYISLVEMRMLASAEKLVLVGYGGFQAILEHLFLSKGHSDNDVIHICMSH